MEQKPSSIYKLQRRPQSLSESELKLMMLYPGLLNEVKPSWACLSHPSTPPVVLALLSKHPDINVRRKVASHPSTPLKNLKELHQQSYLSYEVVNNPSWPISDDDLHLADSGVLHKLSAQQRYKYLERHPTMADKPFFGYFSLEEQLEIARKSLEASHRASPLGPYLHMGGRLAQNPHTHPQVLMLLIHKYATDCYKHPQCPEEALLIMAKGRNTQLKTKMLANPKTPRSVLEILSKDKNARLAAIAQQRLEHDQRAKATQT